MHENVFQIERAKYYPKMPKALAGTIKVVEGGKGTSALAATTHY